MKKPNRIKTNVIENFIIPDTQETREEAKKELLKRALSIEELRRIFGYGENTIGYDVINLIEGRDRIGVLKIEPNKYVLCPISIKERYRKETSNLMIDNFLKMWRYSK